MANFFSLTTLAVQAQSEQGSEENSETSETQEPAGPSNEELAQQAEEAKVNQLNQEINKKRSDINTLQKEIDAYAEQINFKQQEARSLRNQVAILDNQIAKVNLNIESTQIKIEQTNLEIQRINLEIEILEQQIARRKQEIGQLLRLIYRTDQVSYLEVILTNNSFSDFFDQIKYTEQINSDLKSSLDKLKNTKKDSEIQRSNWEDKAVLEEELKDELQQQKDELGERNTAQEILLIQTRLTERQYKNYQYQLQVEQQQINADIVSLEKELRQQLEQRGLKERFKGFGPAIFSWPISPARGITAFFHDPDYPFRYIFEHPAIDIRTFQGTPVKAPESGYVARVKFRGDSSYAYLMIIHNDGLSTVYGHISNVYIQEDQFVTKGQTIAATGGTPGTAGAGRLSTGPHLHFEVRLNGIPVNPLEYLPPF